MLHSELTKAIIDLRSRIQESAAGFADELDHLIRATSPGVRPEGGLIEGPIEESTMAPESPTPSRPIPWGREAASRYGKEFIEGVLWIEAELGLRADYLMACMKFESNLDIKARNPSSSASGLIQFMSFTATNLGTTIETIRQADAMTQLSWVYKYFKEFGTDLSGWDLADTYMAILWPAGIGKPLDYAIFTRGKGRAYAVNRGLDINKDGFVTKREAAQKVIDLYDKGSLEPHVLMV